MVITHQLIVGQIIAIIELLQLVLTLQLTTPPAVLPILAISLTSPNKLQQPLTHLRKPDKPVHKSDSKVSSSGRTCNHREDIYDFAKDIRN